MLTLSPAAAPLPSDASAPGSISATAEVERAHKDPVIDSILATCESIDALCADISRSLRRRDASMDKSWGHA